MATVKKAISIEEKLFRQAQQSAREMGISRSHFFSRAVRSYLRRRCDATITERLNKVYAGGPASEEDASFLSDAVLDLIEKGYWEW